VALTRAKERLIITGDLIDGGQSLQDALRGAGCWPPAGEKPQTLMEGPARAELSYLHFRPPEDFLDLSFAAGAGHEAPLDIEAWFEARRKRLAVYKESLGRRIIKPGARGEEEDSAAPRLRDDAASIVGTLCHKLIFNIFTNSPQTPRQAAAAEGFAPEVFAQQLNEAQAIIDSFTQSALFKKLRDMRLMAAEMPFTFKDADGRIISGVMDAVFQTCGGTLFIADYKSDNIPVGQAARRGTDYARQLGFYKTALQAMFKYAKIEAAVIYMRAAEQVLI
jgi:ATP-dependent exoDNAse (exonuclease V) beta subunit